MGAECAERERPLIMMTMDDDSNVAMSLRLGCSRAMIPILCIFRPGGGLYALYIHVLVYIERALRFRQWFYGRRQLSRRVMRLDGIEGVVELYNVDAGVGCRIRGIYLSSLLSPTTETTRY